MVYAGRDSKQVMNQGKYTYKMSTLEKSINFFMGFNILMMLSIAAGLAVGNKHFYESYSNADYLFYGMTDQA